MCVHGMLAYSIEHYFLFCFLFFFPLIFKRYIILQLLLHVAEYNSRNSDSSLPPGIYFLQKGGGVK